MQIFQILSKCQEKRRINRTLTAKYDMNALRALQKVESVFMQKLSVIYGCDEDEVPVEIDLLGVYNDERSTRLESLVRAFICSFHTLFNDFIHQFPAIFVSWSSW